MLRTRLPLTPKSSFDLHVLSLPPAFVLSQDQTLKLRFEKLTYYFVDVAKPKHRMKRGFWFCYRNVSSQSQSVKLKSFRQDCAAHVSLSQYQIFKERSGWLPNSRTEVQPFI